jgi:predicted ArsR family transcriptional regulator
MKRTKIDDRFFESTRGKIVLMLRAADRTVEELSKELGITDNAVRAQLLALERDGLAHQNGMAKGHRKPHFNYSLTSEAEQLFPKPFDSLFIETIGALKKQFSRGKVLQVLRQTGSDIGARYKPAGKASMNVKLGAAAAAFKDLGGVATVSQIDGQTLISGKNCPLAAAVNVHLEVCKLAESMIGEILECSVEEICEREGSPKCRFVAKV